MPNVYGEAAVRHLLDSERLAKHKRWGGAGHLVGFAGECAVKHAIQTLRGTPKAPYLHFPELIDKAKAHFAQRRSAGLYTVLKLPDLMQGWTVDLRYAENTAVDEIQYKLWRAHAVRLIIAAGLRHTG